MIEQSRFITTLENSEHNVETKSYVCTINDSFLFSKF